MPKKPKKKSKTKRLVEEAFSEMKGEKMPRDQKIAIALSKARKRGARIPKKKGNRNR